MDDRGKTGRKSMLLEDPTLERSITDNIKLGMTYRLAAQCAGVSEAVFHLWMRSAKRIMASEAGPSDAHEEAMIAFFKSVKEAEAICARNSLIKINVAGESSWQAAAWLLERRYPDSYARREHITADVDQTVTESPRDGLRRRIGDIRTRITSARSDSPDEADAGGSEECP